MVSVVVVTPLYGAPLARLVKAPPPTDTCHWYVGVGVPLAATVKVAFWPAVTVWLVGWVVIVGAPFTVRRAGFDVALATLLVASARY